MYKRLEINQKASRRTNPASNIFGARVQAARAAAASLGGYLRQSSRPDLATGLTIAMIAGVSPVYGFYTARLPTIVGAIARISHFLVTGPTNTIALTTAGIMVAFSAQPNYFEFVFALAIASGVVKLLLGLLDLGFIVRYISKSVLTGSLSAATVLIKQIG
jgi:MFS superfamily sulfate permease-like transporter